MATLFCPTCFGPTLHETRDDLGDTVCTACGNVLEENKIVAQVEFVETAGGSSAVLGQYVSATSTRPFGSGLGLSRESRELAVENARKALNQMGSLLSTPPHYVEAARACGGARRRALRRAAASSAAAACARHTSLLRPVFAPSSPLQTACTSSRWRTTSPTAGARRTCWRRACTLCAGAKSRTTC